MQFFKRLVLFHKVLKDKLDTNKCNPVMFLLYSSCRLFKMNEHPKKRKRKTLHPSRYSGQSRAWAYVHFNKLIFFLRIITLQEGTTCVSPQKGWVRNLGLNGQHPLCRLLCWASWSQCTWTFCSVLPAHGETGFSCKWRWFCFHRGEEFCKISVGGKEECSALNGQCTLSMSSSGSRDLVLQTSGQQL